MPVPAWDGGKGKGRGNEGDGLPTWAAVSGYCSTRSWTCTCSCSCAYMAGVEAVSGPAALGAVARAEASTCGSRGLELKRQRTGTGWGARDEDQICRHVGSSTAEGMQLYADRCTILDLMYILYVWNVLCCMDVLCCTSAGHGGFILTTPAKVGTVLRTRSLSWTCPVPRNSQNYQLSTSLPRISQLPLF